MEENTNLNSQKEFEELKNKYEELKSIVESSPFIHYVCKNLPNYPIISLTKNIEEFGISHDYYKENGLNLTQIIHSEDIESVITDLNEYISFEAEEYMLMHRLAIDETQVIWVDNYIKTQKDENGKISHFYGYLIDITTRNELAQNYLNELYKKNIILESVSEQILCFTEDGNLISYHSPPGEFVLNEPENCIGKNIFEILHSTLAKEIISNAMQAFKLDQDYMFILQYKKNDKQYKLKVKIVPSTKNYFFVIMEKTD